MMTFNHLQLFYIFSAVFNGPLAHLHWSLSFFTPVLFRSEWGFPGSWSLPHGLKTLFFHWSKPGFPKLIPTQRKIESAFSSCVWTEMCSFIVPVLCHPWLWPLDLVKRHFFLIIILTIVFVPYTSINLKF